MMLVDTGRGRRGILIYDTFNSCYGYAYNARAEPAIGSPSQVETYCTVYSVQPSDGGQPYVARGDHMQRAQWTFVGMTTLSFVRHRPEWRRGETNLYNYMQSLRGR